MNRSERIAQLCRMIDALTCFAAEAPTPKERTYFEARARSYELALEALLAETETA